MISTLLEDLRQLLYHREFRIPRPTRNAGAINRSNKDGSDQAHPDQSQHRTMQGTSEPSLSMDDAPGIDAVLSDIAIGLWDIERKLRPEEGWHLDRKQRLVYRRATKGIASLARARVTIEDPTGKRYVQGSEGLMKPIELQPTAGINQEVVTETVVPIVYRDDRLIRRGEVFVAVPLENVSAETASSDASDASLPAATPADLPTSEKRMDSGTADTLDLLKDDGKKSI